MKKTPGTEPFHAPAETTAPVVAHIEPPRQKTIERRGVRTEAYTQRYPQIRGGTCEFCGVLDRNVPASFQYQICPHFRGMGEMRCSYCDESKNPTDVVINSVLNIAVHPNNPDQLVVWCNSYECSRKHEARFKVNN